MGKIGPRINVNEFLQGPPSSAPYRDPSRAPTCLGLCKVQHQFLVKASLIVRRGPLARQVSPLRFLPAFRDRISHGVSHHFR